MKSNFTKSDNATIREILLNSWDPIGVNGGPEAIDEYDSYIPRIWRLVSSGASIAEIVAELQRIQTDEMGLAANPRRAEQVARALTARR